jgi:glycosyltransferase involved in cell wall biosynthesis
MRILQLIDSLEPGGAERVAVQYANQLETIGVSSFLCATRKEGLLKQQLGSTVGYLFLERKRTLDMGAVRRLVGFCKKEKINVIHAHASSFFMAFLVKLFLRKMVFVWHDHYGQSEQLDNRPYKMLRFASRYMNWIISVNFALEQWAKAKLKCKQVSFVSNAVNSATLDSKPTITLKGEQGFRIICLANFRAQKDHLNLLKAFELVHKEQPKASLHLIGKNWNDAYYNRVVSEINSSLATANIYNHGQQARVNNLLEQASIGVLSSVSEGLPMALLEYGSVGLGVVCTTVGQCEAVMNNNDYCVPPKDPEALANAILRLLSQPETLKKWRKEFKNRIDTGYSIKAIMPKLKEIYTNCLIK